MKLGPPIPTFVTYEFALPNASPLLIFGISTRSPRQLLDGLCKLQKRIARIPTPYREHMAQHFGLFSMIRSNANAFGISVYNCQHQTPGHRKTQGKQGSDDVSPGKREEKQADGEGFEHASNSQGNSDFSTQAARNPARSTMETLLLELWNAATDSSKLQALELLRLNPMTDAK